MTIEQLVAALTRLVEADPTLARATVVHDRHGPIEGGIVGRKDGEPTLILAPIALDQVGGF